MTETLLWSPSEEDVSRANLTGFLRWLRDERGRDFDGYEPLWRWSVDDLEGFWQAIWDFYGVQASAPPTAVLSGRKMPGVRWFPGARLNYAEHVLARAPGETPALLSIDERHKPVEMSTATLRGQVGALAAALRDMGVGRGDRVAAYLPNIPEATVALLAVTSLGAIWAACAPDFGTQSVIDRFSQIEPKALIAVDGYRFGGRDFDRREVVAQLREALPTVQATILVRAQDEPPGGATISFEDAVAAPREPEFEHVEFNEPLWILFSSGTTGIPKGIVHSHGGILLEHLKTGALHLDLQPGDRSLFHSSTSWMAWNFLIGGLLHGATVVLYDGSPSYPEVGSMWRIGELARAAVMVVGCAYVTGCQKAGVRLGGLDLGALRTAIPTGSPLPLNGWRWLHEELPAGVRIDALCGGTDVCTVFFAGNPLLDVHEGEIAARCLGMRGESWDDSGNARVGEVGEFVITAPMPTMPIGFWNDPDGSRLHDAYFDQFPGVWRQGDWLTITPRDGAIVSGRSDATLNRGGVRLGSAEIYGVVERMDEIADSVVVGVELPGGGYWMPLFVVPAPGAEIDDETRARIVAAIRAQLSPRHVPDEILTAPAVPRTLTGKKLEVPIKRILLGTPVDKAAALGSVAQPEALDWYAELARGRSR